MADISKQYNFEKEDEIYKLWEESGFFNPDNLKGEPFSIMMPPPNVTGVLHLGHAMENTLMDVMARYQRMNGKKVLILPGTDHAAIATQAKVEKVLNEKGIKDPRKELGREKLLAEIRSYAENSKATILSQIKKMGTSCDWSRLAYTFDEKRNLAVNTVFKKMYDDGLIYRGFRVVNWSVKGQSTCSDDEVVHVERQANFYTFKYSKDFPITISTTRPETKLGDTAVAVNPKDKRYKKYIGQIFKVDIGAKNPLEIKIIADGGVDMEFGTGALGVTPAHSTIDFEMYEKQKSKNDPIGFVQVIGTDGKMTAEAGKEYVGLSVIEAREKFVAWLSKNGLLEKVEEVTQNVGTSERFKDVIEALPMTQWFVDVNKIIPEKNKSLKDLMKESVTKGHNGNPYNKVKINPERFEKVYLNWIDNLRDWCISRQIWWGHRIPVWYKGGEIYCDIKPPLGDEWKQDEDTLDTWFSSGLWTFSTLGWPAPVKTTGGKPQKIGDLKEFHPTSWMQMGYEILFFWMARMILMSTYAMDEIPFKDVYIHGMVRDEKGKKFSKSSGNNLDPLDVIKKYGADALRISLISGTTPGNDLKFYSEKVESSRNFVTKLWNVSRYILSSYPTKECKLKINELKPSDVWILQKFSVLIEDVKNDFNKFQFSQAAEKIREFTWSDFADWYLEVSKYDKNKEVKSWILNNILEDLLKMLHPFIPFVTENIWTSAKNKNLLMVEKWPTAGVYRFEMEDWKRENNVSYFTLIKDVICAIRNIRIENKLDLKLKLRAIVRIPSQENHLFKNVLEQEKEIIKKLRTGVDDLIIETSDELMENAYHVTIHGINIYIPLEGIIDIKKEKEKVKKEIVDVEKYLLGLNARLKNGDFMSKASKDFISKIERSKRHNDAKLAELKKYLQFLK